MRLSKIQKYPNYYVTDTGEVYSKKFGRWGKPQKKKLQVASHGYIQVFLYKNNKLKTYRVHRLVAEAFIPNPKNLKEVNHKNGIKTDNRVQNLEWSTRAENIRHAFHVLHRKNGMTGKTGDKCPTSKIILQIKDGKIIAEFYGIHEAYRKTGISMGNICSVCKKQRNYAGGYQWKYKEEVQQ